MIPSGHADSFTRDHLPPAETWPLLRLDLAGLAYPERLNAVSELLDRHLAEGRGNRPCLIAAAGTLSYAALAERVNRFANVLTRDLGLAPGNRVLLRAPNTPAMVAAYLAVLKAGGVAVATMPLLRARELVYPLDKAAISLALADPALVDELAKAADMARHRPRVVALDDAFDQLATRPGYDACTAADTAADDVALIGFTSGTTGVPKGTMHFHRDLIATADTYGRHVLAADPDDRFVGSPPLAFTFGLGGLVLFPLRIGAATVLPARTAPDDLLTALEQFRASVMFTAPTAYRAMLGKLAGRDIASLRIAVSAGEALPRATFDAWKAATGLELMDGIGATEMLHIFIGAPRGRIRPGATGLVVPGYEAKIVDDDFAEVPRGTPGRLVVRGPTGCRYLDDERQAKYVQNGWNVTGDTYLQDADGYFWYRARTDDMIVSAGYNIAGPEVEASLLAHPAVAECGVVAAPDAERGAIVKAYVVLKPGFSASDDLTRALQDHVKADIAPYKYPRAIAYVATLPRTETGKLQRFALRAAAETARDTA